MFSGKYLPSLFWFVTSVNVNSWYPAYVEILSFDMFNWIELSKSCSKALLISINLLCILISLTTFGFAVADTKILKQYGEEQAAGSFTGDVIIIAACVYLIVVAVFGCVAVIKDNAKLLYIYILFLMKIILLELMIAIYVSVQRYGLQYRVAEWMRDDFFTNVTEDGRAEHEKMWDDLQLTYSCCGLNGPEDYAAIGRPISLSCCSRAIRARTAAAQQNLYKICIETSTYFTEGCEDEILYVLNSDGDYLLGVAITSFWFEATGMLLAMLVANHIKNSVHVYKNTVKY